MKRNIILSIIAVTIIIAGIFALTHSFIVINVQGGGADGTTARLTDSAGTETQLSLTSNTARKLVRKGNYQVTVVGQEKSYITTVKTKPFLVTTTVEAELHEEASRSFIGDNPGVCMYYIGQKLISGECDDYASSLLEHTAATPTTPSYAQEIPNNEILGISKGIITTKASNQIILTQDTEGYVAYYVQELDGQFTGGERRMIDVSNASGEYKITPYKDGFLVYSNDFIDMRYFSSVDAKPQVISVDEATNKDLKLKSVAVGRDTISVLYTADNIKADDVRRAGPNTAQSGTSEVVVISGDSQQHYTLDTIYSTVQTCGTQKLCALNAVGLTVYDINTSKPRYSYSLPGVKELHNSSTSGVIATTNTGVISYDIDANNGHYNYTLGGYSVCGLLTPVSNGYMLCVATTKGNRKALFVNQTTPNTDSIDKKLLAIENTNGVKEVSGMGTIVYIVSDYGDPIYDATSKIYISDPAKVKIANLAIKDAITKSGIDTSKYTIINTGD